MGLVSRKTSLTLGDGSKVTPTRVVYTFIDPAGARANWDWMVKQLVDRPKLTFEMFDDLGGRHALSQATLDKVVDIKAQLRVGE